MALQSSGQIKMSELNTEFGLAAERQLGLKDASDGTVATINTANAASDRPNGTAPHAISEFYSYDHSASSVTASDYYWQGDGVNDTLRFTNHGSTLFSANTTDDMSYSGWFRIDETTNQQQWLGSFSEATASGANQIFIQYRNTELQLRYRHGGGGNFHQKFMSVTANSSVTGISTGGWTSTNRGNTNSDGFVFLTFTYDASNRTASSGIKIYWNGAELTTTAQSNNLTSPSAWNVRSFAIGDAVGNAPNNANVFKGGIDQVSVYSKVLSQSEITALYNSGVPITGADASVTSGLIAEYRLENNGTNTTGTFPSVTNTGGSFQTYA